jgi:hypothetical protein
MAITEGEARTKWCPMARAYYGNAVDSCAINRAPHNDDVVQNNLPQRNSYCIASGCMMWRWDDPQTRVKDEHKKPFGPSRNLAIALAPASEREPMPNRRGHCGLAGQSQFGESAVPTSDPTGFPSEQVK